MKQRLSVGALALQLSWKPVLLVFLAAAGVQVGAVYMKYQEFSDITDLVASALPLAGKLGFAALLIVLILVGTEFRGAKFSYTLRRLGVGERSVALIWAVVYAGWFFLYWMMQLGVMFGTYAWFTRDMVMEPTALMLSSYIEEYFHLLFPLEEYSGYLRNAVMCVGFGCSASFSSHQLRHGGSPWPSVILTLVWALLAQGELGELTTDIVLILYTAFHTITTWATLRKGEEDE